MTSRIFRCTKHTPRRGNSTQPRASSSKDDLTNFQVYQACAPKGQPNPAQGNVKQRWPHEFSSVPSMRPEGATQPSPEHRQAKMTSRIFRCTKHAPRRGNSTQPRATPWVTGAPTTFPRPANLPPTCPQQVGGRFAGRGRDQTDIASPGCRAARKAPLYPGLRSRYPIRGHSLPLQGAPNTRLISLFRL